MWVKQCHKPPMTGNDKHETICYINVYHIVYQTGPYVHSLCPTFIHILVSWTRFTNIYGIIQGKKQTKSSIQIRQLLETAANKTEG